VSRNETLIDDKVIDDKELRLKMKIGIAALNRVKKAHTSRNRARQIIDIINGCKI
jgi:spore maturation protein CgeB